MPIYAKQMYVNICHIVSPILLFRALERFSNVNELLNTAPYFPRRQFWKYSCDIRVGDTDGSCSLWKQECHKPKLC